MEMVVAAGFGLGRLSVFGLPVGHCLPVRMASNNTSFFEIRKVKQGSGADEKIDKTGKTY
jgi:hypothetical protein